MIWAYTVSCEPEVQGYIGGTVLLPCIYTSPVPQTFTISWRDKDDSNVLDIKDNAINSETQSARFKGRVISFPDVYMRGNFSILLRDVQQDDAGIYECHIRIADGSQQMVSLSVSGDRVVVAMTPPGPAGGAVAGASVSVQLLLLLLLFYSAL
ncbi:hypothetical protein PAMA_014622 [Pampus argenteus]